MSLTGHPTLDAFVAALRDLWRRERDDETRLLSARDLFQRIVSDADLRTHSRHWPSTEGRKNLLIYEDPEFDFVINAVVRAPHHAGNVHDHVHAWILYGVLDGVESLERYERRDDGRDPAFADLTLTETREGVAGTVDLVEPYAIHAEQGGPTRSVGLILRSKRLPGRTLQHQYDLSTGVVIERQIPIQVPFDLATIADGVAR